MAPKTHTNLNLNLKTVLLTLLTLSALLPTMTAAAAARYNYPHLAHAHRAQAQARPNKRQQLIPLATTAAPATPTTYTLVTPSPGAEPVPVTSQSQVVESYVPQVTLCSLRLVPETLSMSGNKSYFYPATARPGTGTGGVAAPSGYATGTGGGAAAAATYAAPIPPYPLVNQTNPSISYSATEGCQTAYIPTATTVCATTLTGLITTYPVSRCDQAVTFSSQFGYAESVPPGVTDAATLPAADVQTLTTFFQAPWQAFTSGPGVVPADVTERVCSVPPGYGAGYQCVDMREVWTTRTEVVPTSMTTTVDFSTTVSEPGEVFVGTYHEVVTEKGTEFVFSSELVLEYSYEALATDVSTLARSTGPVVSVGAGRTTSETVSVYVASATAL